MNGLKHFSKKFGRRKRHVLGWMEWLSELEWALAILAAYTDDLGMTLSAEERAGIREDAAYRRHCDRFPEEIRQIEQLRTNGEHSRANLIENHIITDYVRVTHAGQPGGRMAGRRFNRWTGCVEGWNSRSHCRGGKKMGSSF